MVKPNIYAVILVGLLAGLAQYTATTASFYLVEFSGIFFGLFMGTYYCVFYKQSVAKALLYMLISGVCFYVSCLVFTFINPISFTSGYDETNWLRSIMALLWAGGIGAFGLALGFHFLYSKITSQRFLAIVVVGGLLSFFFLLNGGPIFNESGSSNQSIQIFWSWLWLFFVWQTGVALTLTFTFPQKSVNSKF